jgi:hypothetical protein
LEKHFVSLKKKTTGTGIFLSSKPKSVFVEEERGNKGKGSKRKGKKRKQRKRNKKNRNRKEKERKERRKRKRLSLH